MKHILVILFVLVFSGSIDAQLLEEFTDIDLTENPTWQGDLDNFAVNFDGQLQLNTSGADTSILATAVEMPDNSVWEMEFQLNFNPSANNRLRIYLQSNTTNYPDVDGYYLEIGESNTTDALRLFRADNGSKTEIAAATEGAVALDPVQAKFKVTRSNTGDWAIFANYEGGDILNLEATGFDDTYLGGNLFFGLWCKNSSTNSQNFFFDNISISPLLADVTAPQILNIQPLSLTEIELSFDEPMDSMTAVNPSNYVIDNGIGNPQSVNWNTSNQSKVLLTLSTPMTNLVSYNLEVQDVEDRAENSIISSTIPFNTNFESPQIIDLIVVNDSELELLFSQPLDPTTASLSNNYEINNSIGNPILVDFSPMEPDRVFLEFGTLFSNGVAYTLDVANIQDLIGIEMQSQSIPFDFLIGETIEAGDLVINEILFNPITGGSDYVEIYNNSDKFIDISDLIIGNTQRSSGIYKNVEVDFIMKPEEYVVLTADSQFVSQNYTVLNRDFLFENTLPLFNDREGNVSIFAQYDLDTVLIDSFDYTVDLHFPLLDNKEGTSLERISFSAATQSISNWHSASTLVGGGTPTYKNSQFRSTNSADNIFNIIDPVFSPDEDGFKDFLLIDYNLETQGYVATVNIYDAKGRLVKSLFQNELLGLEGTLKWDGLTDEGRKARIGIYVILAEIFSPEKNAMQFKSACVVAGQLD